MNRFSALIEQKARDVIEVYWESRARWNPAKSLKNLTAQATQEYENRFLIELIQNAYDAHPAGTRDGGVYIRLNREEEPHGVLYVANRGVPFKKSNFLAITEIAQSDKLLFIPHALESKARSLYVLPNPFSEAGRRFYRVVGTGLRYQFQITL